MINSIYDCRKTTRDKMKMQITNNARERKDEMQNAQGKG